MTSATALLIGLSVLGASPRGEVIDFTATWCGPCQQMSPTVAKLQRMGYPIRKVDIDQNRALAKQYNVTALPTFLLVVDGQEVRRVVGMTSEGQLTAMLQEIPRGPAPGELGPGESQIVSNPPARQPQPPVRTAEVRSPSPGRGVNLGQPETLPENTVAQTQPVSTESERKLEPTTWAISATSEPFPSSVRLRVTDKDGVNLGSGVVISSHPGEALILTCAHIFRNMKSDTVINVDVFQGDKQQTYQAKLLKFNLESDIGLLTITCPDQLPTSRVGSSSRQVGSGELVFCIGCSEGKLPTKEQMRVTALNRYRGPDNIECSTVPVQGRSGGGLFNQQNEVIGVCIAADKRDQRGLYSGLKAIHEMLHEVELDALFLDQGTPATPAAEPAQFVATPPAAQQQPAAPAQLAPAAPQTPAVTASNSEIPQFDAPAVPAAAPPAVAVNPPAPAIPATPETVPAPVAPQPNRGVSPETLAQMQEAIGESGDAEVICIVRPLDNPQANSKVVIINRASKNFVSYLNGELESQPIATSQRVNQPQAAPRQTAEVPTQPTQAQFQPRAYKSRVVPQQPPAPASTPEPQRYVRGAK